MLQSIPSVKYSLHAFVLHFPLLARQRILQSRIVATVHNLLAYLSEATLAGHDEQWRIEERMILPQIFFSLCASPAELNIVRKRFCVALQFKPWRTFQPVVSSPAAI